MRIASVEDDVSQAEQIVQLLDEAGFTCASFATGSAFLRALRDQAFDLLIMDWQLPDVSGYEVVSWVRQHSGRLPPILFLTSRMEEADIVAGLAIGADDYLAKPIRPGEFIARVRALLRRAYPDAAHDDQLIRQGDYVIDVRRRVIMLSGLNIELSPREFDLALFLFRNIGRLLSRDVIEQAVWGRAMEAGSRTLDTHISRLRIKLALRPDHGVRLMSVYSHGYRFEEVAAAPVMIGRANA
ncbi:two component transcriptional regulator, winged helix family [Cupriavidus sp. YR651]|uniref:response regulator transcription factor n=1 Tax=Cupriavidus sp. YR651 TaxID=1855315 RepID=UPI000880D159|nr:response regulator transcription factor [Cupriavidus sp. YR651]SDC75565.1 two component transcriptional regulator, winged helix family [Cupriavidus sp. YR651]